MSDKVEINHDKYCRACLYDFEVNENFEEFKRYNIFPDLVDKFLSCTTIKAEFSDKFSKYLCDYCYEKLNKFHAFQIMCINSVQKYQEMLGMHELEFGKENIRKRSLKEYESNGSDNTQNLLALAFFEEEIHDSVLSENSLKDNPLLIQTNKRCGLRKSSRKMMTKITKYPKVRIQCKKAKSNDSDSVEERSSISNADTIDSDYCTPTTKTATTSVSSKCSDEESSSKSSNVYKCERCSVRFFVEHRLIAHKRSHDGLVPYPCSHEGCTRGFNRFHCLSEHLKQHEGTNRWFICEEIECGRKYKHKATLNIHLRRYHKKGPKLKSFVCEICGKLFKSSAILNDHRFTHKDKSELPFACDQPQCKYRFSNKEKLRVHMMRHAGIKKFECPHCGLRKTTQNELKIHINYHTLERTFPCRFCTQICNSAGNLRVHIRTVHERAKNYACRFCERAFAKPDTRKYHEMIHTGEKPHQCAECGKRFVQPAALRTHKRVHQKQQIQKTSPSKQDSIDGKITESVSKIS